jgi:phosphohistidine phosphatase SixA
MAERFVFLARHGSRKVEPLEPERTHRLQGHSEEPANAEKTGRDRTVSIAGALADQLDTRDLLIDRILCSPHAVARDTAAVFGQVLAVRRRLATPEIDVIDLLEPAGRSETLRTVVEELSDSTVLIVGHQPQLTELARRLLGPRLPSQALPLAGSEVACLRIGEDPRLLYLLTEKPAALKADFREKIKSKLDVAKFFLGALVVNASVLLSSTLSQIWSSNMRMSVVMLMALGSIAMFIALGLTVATLLAFDRLSMPPEFWSEHAALRRSAPGARAYEPATWSVRRPPSEATVVLFYETMHVWTRMFEPALVAAIVGILCFAIAIVVKNTGLAAPGIGLGVGAAAALSAATILYYLKHRPKLGFDD